MAVTEQLEELQLAVRKDLISSAEAAHRARAILDRAKMTPIDLAHFLSEKGYEGHRLLSAVGSFGRMVKAAYTEEYGRPPMRVEQVINGEQRLVNAYLELDRDMIEKVYEVWA